MDDRQTPGRKRLRSFSSPCLIGGQARGPRDAMDATLLPFTTSVESGDRSRGSKFVVWLCKGLHLGWGRRDGTIQVSDQLATSIGLGTRHTTNQNQINQMNTLFFWLQVTTHIEEYFHLVLSGKGGPCTLANCPVAFQADL